MIDRKTAIRVNNLGKQYWLGGPQEPYHTFRDAIINTIKTPWNIFHRDSHPNEEGFWALKDVSFNVEHGEAVGIIGRNGAGKSTLLKILSRITAPTEGIVELHGRVGSLLEVGTGFHPEMTGRENIFLNGSILGMRRGEIEQKFDQIVKFAEVEKFLDTPVKRYSSGMYVRLAFAVAAHLEPEILVVDEVLAVGDVEFQKKCLGKMGDVAKEGRTVLFVSHNMAAINQLCNRAILIDHGTIAYSGEPKQVIDYYLNSDSQKINQIDLSENKGRKGTKKVQFSHVEIRNQENQVCNRFSMGDDVYFNFSIRSREQTQNSTVMFAIELKNSDGIHLCNMIDIDSGFQITDIKPVENISVCLKDIRLYPDTYYVTFWTGSTGTVETYDYVEDSISFEVVDGRKLTMRNLPRSNGLFFFTPTWRRDIPNKS